MRINVYSQELTTEVKLVSKVADTGRTYYGIRLYLASPDILHHTPEDDDRSAITVLDSSRSILQGERPVRRLPRDGPLGQHRRLLTLSRTQA